MKVTGILETALHVEDVARSREFYQNIFGFPVLQGDDRFCALNVADKQVLLLFKKGGSTEPLTIPGGVIPPHGGDGHLHFAFSIPAADLAAWEARLREHGVAIKGRVNWPRGGTSIYFRDPDGHLAELVTPGIWATY
jgi:catechol 2,3-dioxygenase-like lactoylglutathione lyase family enzyme